MLVTIMTDASVCPNYLVGGFGYWIASNRGKEGGGKPFNTTTPDSFNGELKAVVCSLHIAIKRGFVISGDEVLIQLDNMSVVNLLNKEYAQNPKRQDIIELYAAVEDMVKTHNLTLRSRWVKGHSSRKENRFKSNVCCDDRAKQGLKEARKIHRRQNTTQPTKKETK